MDALSMAVSTQLVGGVNNMSRVMMDATQQVNDLSNKMLTAGLEMKLKGLEMGKGQNFDAVA